MIATAADVSHGLIKVGRRGICRGHRVYWAHRNVCSMGAVYAPVMVMASFIYKLPRKIVPAAKMLLPIRTMSDKDAVKMTVHNVDAELRRTPQFGCCTGLGCVATGAYGLWALEKL